MKIWKLVTFGLTIATLFVACGKQPTDEEHTVSDAPIIENNSYEKCTLTFSWWGGNSRNAATLGSPFMGVVLEMPKRTAQQRK